MLVKPVQMPPKSRNEQSGYTPGVASHRSWHRTVPPKQVGIEKPFTNVWKWHMDEGRPGKTTGDAMVAIIGNRLYTVKQGLIV